jgi:hypothetical protein
MIDATPRYTSFCLGQIQDLTHLNMVRIVNPVVLGHDLHGQAVAEGDAAQGVASMDLVGLSPTGSGPGKQDGG